MVGSGTAAWSSDGNTCEDKGLATSHIRALEEAIAAGQEAARWATSLQRVRWRRSTVRVAVCLVLWLGTGAYLLPFVDRGWIAHDDGMLGQTAERVLAGEIPHRDFDDPYTGGLAYLHAVALKIFGVRLLSLRWLLLGVTLAWVPVV
jgi:hypothetical protein